MMRPSVQSTETFSSADSWDMHSPINSEARAGEEDDQDLLAGGENLLDELHAAKKHIKALDKQNQKLAQENSALRRTSDNQPGGKFLTKTEALQGKKHESSIWEHISERHRQRFSDKLTAKRQSTGLKGRLDRFATPRRPNKVKMCVNGKWINVTSFLGEEKLTKLVPPPRQSNAEGLLMYNYQGAQVLPATGKHSYTVKVGGGCRLLWKWEVQEPRQEVGFQLLRDRGSIITWDGMMDESGSAAGRYTGCVSGTWTAPSGQPSLVELAWDNSFARMKRKTVTFSVEVYDPAGAAASAGESGESGGEQGSGGSDDDFEHELQPRGPRGAAVGAAGGDGQAVQRKVAADDEIVNLLF